MSKYTTELRFYLETLAGYLESQSYANVADVIDKSWNKVFDFDFPIFESSYKETLCKKILLHYYTREIGMETVGLWKLRLQTKMNEIMPFYNRLYEDLNDKFNIMYSADMYIEREDTRALDSTRDIKGTNESEQSGTSKLTNESEDSAQSRFLDTPQGGLNGILDSDYLTNATINDGTSESTANSESSNTTSAETTSKDIYDSDEKGTMQEHRYGSDNRYEAMERYTQELFNIDMRVINNLSDLFMKVW